MRVIYHAGVWDLFHAGHLRVLEASRRLGDLLVVGVVTDQGTETYKGRRPVIDEHDRLAIIRGLACVDAAFLQPGTDPTPVIEDLAAMGRKPDVMAHGDDWTELREGNDTLKRLGVKFQVLPYGPGPGTTEIIERIQAACGGGD